MTIDDILDYDISANVERKKSRALPRGAISIEFTYIFALTSLSYADLALPYSLRISVYVWLLYVLYPTCKR
ncbi:hypothetical protein EDD18DRAFT_1277979 [Armillaria luteobubalina]|uniref:Uncharacterized protein n=1 Tax=Armillaria luteobubalina TaxID=153913 RepID=A0AA39UT62_9AGAR|nr:hypothetical protein EDD18DRAFT_1277979 [Armillaria luteobubalina]